MSAVSWLSIKKENQENDLIEKSEKRFLRFLDISKTQGIRWYKRSIISKVLDVVGTIQKFIYDKSIEYIFDISDYARHNSKMSKMYDIKGVLKVNFTIDDLIQDANELSLQEISVFINKIKSINTNVELNKNKKYEIIIEPIITYVSQIWDKKFYILVFVKKQSLLASPIKLAELTMFIDEKEDYEVETLLRKIIVLAKFYSFLNEIKYPLSVDIVRGLNANV